MSLFLLFALGAHAHIGSPDTFVQTSIGPYRVLIAAHPPAIYPGALELDLRFNPDDHLTLVTAALDDAPATSVPLVLDGTAATSLWAASSAGHTLHLAVQGSLGSYSCSVTLPAGRAATISPERHFPPSLLIVLSLTLFALAGLLALRRPRRPGYAALLAAAGLLAGLLALHRPATTTVVAAALSPDGHLQLALNNPSESFAGLLPDHGKLLHLFLIREPGKDVFLHLHPVQQSPGRFDAALPAMPPGTYTLFADFYRANGDGETATLRLALPQQSHSATRDPDDTTAVLPPFPQNARVPHPSAASSPMGGEPTTLHTAQLRDGYTLQLAAPAHLVPLHANLLQVTLLDPAGAPPADMALYLGMAAHAVVLRSDDQVFAHIHPGGTLPMLMPAASTSSMPGAPGPSTGNMGTPGQDLRAPDATMPPASNAATIPYGFPSPGRYRIYVQMKHGRIVETAAFDLEVAPN